METDLPSNGIATDAAALARIEARTADTYSAVAETFDAQCRSNLFERPWLEALLQAVPRGGAVLDVGCGAGRPIGEYLTSCGVRLTGLDVAEPMLALARARLPDKHFVRQDMRHGLPEGPFSAIVA